MTGMPVLALKYAHRTIGKWQTPLEDRCGSGILLLWDCDGKPAAVNRADHLCCIVGQMCFTRPTGCRHEGSRAYGCQP